MTMYIIIVMNIYLTKTNEKNLKAIQGWSMSGLVNMLLNEYWEKHSPQDVVDNVERPLVETHIKLEKEVMGKTVSPKVINDRLNGIMKGETLLKLCKHNANPAFCKFSKPGKPCK